MPHRWTLGEPPRNTHGIGALGSSRHGVAAFLLTRGSRDSCCFDAAHQNILADPRPDSSAESSKIRLVMGVASLSERGPAVKRSTVFCPIVDAQACFAERRVERARNDIYLLV
jgi:hypothetical protein